MYLTVGGLQCLRGRIHLPLSGAWTADLAIDPDVGKIPPPVAGQAVTVGLGEGGFTLQGTVRRVNNASQTVLARIVGGAGGLPTPMQPKSFQQIDVKSVIQSILGAAKEQLSASVDAQLLSTQLPSWSINAAPAAIALTVLAQKTGANWRVLPDGTVWFGVDAFPQTAMKAWDQSTWLPQEYRVSFYAQDPRVLPGDTWSAGKVADVAHDIEPDIQRSTVWFVDPFVVAAVSESPLT